MKTTLAKKPTNIMKGTKDLNPIEFYTYIQEGKLFFININA